MSNKKNSNAHRKNKYHFSVYLTSSERANVELVKKKNNLKTNKDFIIHIINDE